MERGAIGDLSALRRSLEEGLEAKLTANEIKEILIQLYAYAGFPRSLNALTIYMVLLKERKSHGVRDEEGPLPTPRDPSQNLLELGTKNQTCVVGMPVKGEIFEFAPTMDRFLKEHLFGDIFQRDNLSFHDRELATLGMLSVIPGVEPQLKAHIRCARNVGVKENKLLDISHLLRTQIGEKEAEIFARLLSEK